MIDLWRTRWRRVLAALIAAAAMMPSLRADDVQQQMSALEKRFERLSSEGKYRDAEALARQMIALAETSLAGQPDVLALRLYNLAAVYHVQGKHSEAEPIYKRSLAMWEQAAPPNPLAIIQVQMNLAGLYFQQSRYAEAAPLAERVAAQREKSLGADHAQTGEALNLRGVIELEQGRFSDAEPLIRRALAIWEKALGPQDVHVAHALENLAIVCKEQGRLAEAEAFYLRALAVKERALGREHSDVAAALSNLSGVYRLQERYAEGEELLKRALDIWSKTELADRPYEALGLHNLGVLYAAERRFAEAEPLLHRALAMLQQALGPNHQYVGSVLNDLADLHWKQEQYAAAEPLVERAASIRDRAGVAPGDRYESYLLRARVAWGLDRRSEAVADLRQAMLLAEQQRRQSSGGEHERAAAFSKFAAAFEQMVAWQAALGDVGEALNAVDRSRARSLLDEFGFSGADLDAGRSAAERQQLQQRETELKTAIARLEEQFAQLDKEDDAQRKRLATELDAARQRLYDHAHEVRTSSPVYRNLLSLAGGPPRLSQVQRHLARDDGLLLVYLLGEQGGWVISIGPKQASLAALNLDEAAAGALGSSAGPLTAGRLKQAFHREGSQGLVQQLADPRAAASVAPKLAQLWRTLIPDADRQALSAGRVKRLLVVPDGPLALLPFETLVVEHETEVKYLLDIGPPILYGPSAAVLLNLQDRPESPAVAVGPMVLSVGEPAYAAAGPAGGGPASSSSARSRYAGRGGRLSPLPYSGTEVAWVEDVFRDQGLGVGSLVKDRATEAAVRAGLPGRRIVHLACHGLADQTFGNYFGALALTPGPRGSADPADDGFLTLAEIYELNLKSCELAILSACETNYGPQQQGEGTWALSRGFVVAGARRVVASNWLVDDEAAASLVSVFCSGVAKGQQAGAVDYAAALQKAKRWVRQQDKWNSPYFWGTFVLVGPN